MPWLPIGPMTARAASASCAGVWVASRTTVPGRQGVDRGPAGIDPLLYMALDRRGAELLLQVLTEREEKNSVAIASNESFGGWTRTFTDPRLCAAIVDRLGSGR
jgi:IstB-like ATP binding protein